MQFILGVSITLNIIFILGVLFIYKLKPCVAMNQIVKNDIETIEEQEIIKNNSGINKDAIVDYKSAMSFIK